MQLTQIALALCIAAAAVSAGDIEEVATFGWGNEPTGVAVSTSGRVFVNFPRWFQNHSAPSVAEIVNGKMVPYPNAEWNSWAPGDDTKSKFVCVQSVFIDHADTLWILDPAAAFLGNATGPKLLKVDLATDTVSDVIHFAEDVAPTHSYLNDVRVTADRKFGFLSDSNLGGLKVVDLAAGTARAVLQDHPSTHAEANVEVIVEGQSMYLAHNGQPATFQSDGIAVLNVGGVEYLYYHAVTAVTFYRVPTALLTDASKTPAEVAAGVEAVAQSGFHDGLVVAADASLKGVLYLTALEKDGVDRLSVDGEHRILPFVVDELLQWPDSMSVPLLRKGADNWLYVTASQVNFLPIIKDAKPRRNVYGLYRAKIPDDVVEAFGAGKSEL